jgi:hypothetical protein
MVIFAGMETPSLGGRLISGKIFQFFGNLSYSLYLWHWPLLAFARNLFGLDLSVLQAGSAAALSVILARLSYRFVERPFLDARSDALPYLLVGATSVAALSLIGAAVAVLHGLPQRYAPEAAAMYEASFEFNPRRAQCHNEHAPVRTYAANCVFGATGVAPDVAVWGDSHGAELAVALGRRAGEVGRSVMEITSSACPPSLGYAVRERGWCPQQNRTTLDGLTRDSHIKAVVLATNAPRYSQQLALKEGYGTAVRALVAAGKHVFVLQQIPIMRNDPPARVGMAVRLGLSPDDIGRPRVEYDRTVGDWNLFVEKMAAIPGVEVLSPAAVLCDGNLCHEFKRGIGVLYFDADHLSIPGATFMANRLMDRVYGSRPLHGTEQAYSGHGG